MRFRIAAVTALAVAGLTGVAACGSSGGGSTEDTGSRTSSSPVIDNTGAASTPGGAVENSAGMSGGPSAGTTGGAGSAAAFCAKLEQASSKFGDLSSSASDPSKLQDALKKTVSYFQELDSAAPSELKPAIDDLVTGMKAAEKALTDPSSADSSTLQNLASKLATDAQKLGDYANEHCTGS
jgi:hypothetical protein